ncbi:hypothetical protein [Staphylococcus condimenti]|uniref:hypothetical protein n=1 Tax=Staphylococcus condimenti TaxID=70255 RepID=UPI0013EEB8BB|nr:hypothetical protein [Staphylococcus condimenti]
MKKKALLPLLLGFMGFIADCVYSNLENTIGYFSTTFVKNMDNIMYWLGSRFNNDY